MRLSKPLFWLFALLWFAAGTWWYGSCSKCTSCSTAAVPAVTEKIVAEAAALPGFSISDSNLNLSTSSNLKFSQSGYIPVLPVEMNSILDSVVAYCKNHTDKKITVTGHYKADEKNSSTFENLGLARADEIKKWMVSKGLPDSTITIQSQLNNDLAFTAADTLVGGISMMINNPVVATTTALKDDLFAPRTIYFETGKSNLYVNAELKNYLQQANTYLQAHADKKLLVTGYTDNVGKPEINIQLSAGRAEFVKNELIKQGITVEKMESLGKGMSDPIADNSTPDGRAKNRRVTIQIQ
jgi:OmpA-OmpF porin, OOP family